jgi:hypothetical protein
MIDHGIGPAAEIISRLAAVDRRESKNAGMVKD